MCAYLSFSTDGVFEPEIDDTLESFKCCPFYGTNIISVPCGITQLEQNNRLGRQHIAARTPPTLHLNVLLADAALAMGLSGLPKALPGAESSPVRTAG